MFNKHYIFVYFVILIPLVVSWTIDLPEIRRHLFDNTERVVGDEFGVPGEFFYDNIDGNSKHNSQEDHMKYASGYGYQVDMEQKVANIAKDGGRYLEGLRRSIENYIGVLTNCTNMNFTLAANATSNSAPVPPPSAPVGEGVSAAGVGVGAMAGVSCGQLTRVSERVRRLAELAAWAARRLQDLAYAQIYNQDVSEEEDELIFRLAWFLDKLAELTGFRPNPNQFLEDPPVSTTPRPSLVSNIFSNPVGAPELVKDALLRCLKLNSSAPATERCAYPLPVPPAIVAMFNLNATTSPSPVPQTQTPASGPESLELLTGSDSPTFTGSQSTNLRQKRLSIDPAASPARLNPYLQGIRNRSPNTSSLRPKRILKKRSIDENPTINLMKYFVKHHVWTNSNPAKTKLKYQNPDFDVKNDLPLKIQKRSLFRRKSPHLHVPEHTLKLMKERIKATIGTHFYKNREQMLKLKNTLDSIRSITYKKSVTKANIHKRSIDYETMSLPRRAEEPTQDISYYSKNKPGTNTSPDQLQAARVRAGLEQVFQTGNIETVRRYGANYNPLVPQPFYAGVLKSIADI